jgi:hypothetical protein
MNAIQHVVLHELAKDKRPIATAALLNKVGPGSDKAVADLLARELIGNFWGCLHLRPSRRKLVEIEQDADVEDE